MVRLHRGATQLLITVPEFWQQFPKAIDGEPGTACVRLFPGTSADLHELQGGEQKTHRLELRLQHEADDNDEESALAGGGVTSDEGLAGFGQLILRPCAQLERVPIAGLPQWDGADEGVLARLDRLAEEFLTGPWGIYANRDRVDEFGWRNHGEIHASHEELYYSGPQPLISHYNNQFDLLAGCLLQYLRTGDTRWWEIADPLARHVIDIDIYHTQGDRAAYSGGLFWFTDHYVHAHTSTHRTYSRRNKPATGSYGGGPGCEHNFTTGLLLYHFLTGNRLAKEAVLSLCDWVLAMDDGRRTILGAVDEGPTGLASRPHSPGRGAANSISALIDGYLLTQDRKYLDYAEVLIRRCIHPSDDIEALDLLNAEKSWSYPMFLVSVMKYLECKAENEEFDSMWTYGRESLVHYGRWMAENERSYLDRPEELEFPTEAWAAQEFRKANVMRMIGQLVDDPLRTQLQQKGTQLADRAWRDLEAFETRTATRAMAVMLTEGLRDAELRQGSAGRHYGATAAPGVSACYSKRPGFVPQKERVKRKLKSLRGLASLAGAAVKPQRWRRLLNSR